jgi:ketosteroid isomerase-like protein
LVWDVSRRVFHPAVYHGLDGFWRFVEQVDEMRENLQFVPEEFIDAGDHVLTSIRLSGWGRGSGVQAEMRGFAIWTFREGKLSRVTGGFRDRAEALEPASLRE